MAGFKCQNLHQDTKNIFNPLLTNFVWITLLSKISHTSYSSSLHIYIYIYIYIHTFIYVYNIYTLQRPPWQTHNPYKEVEQCWFLAWRVSYIQQCLRVLQQELERRHHRPSHLVADSHTHSGMTYDIYMRLHNCVIVWLCDCMTVRLYDVWLCH